MSPGVPLLILDDDDVAGAAAGGSPAIGRRGGGGAKVKLTKLEGWDDFSDVLKDTLRCSYKGGVPAKMACVISEMHRADVLLRAEVAAMTVTRDDEIEKRVEACMFNRHMTDVRIGTSVCSLCFMREFSFSVSFSVSFSALLFLSSAGHRFLSTSAAGHCWPLLITAGHCCPLLATTGAHGRGRASHISSVHPRKSSVRLRKSSVHLRKSSVHLSSSSDPSAIF
jgi:hypothetical protein